MTNFNEQLVSQVRDGKLAIENVKNDVRIEELVAYIFPIDVPVTEKAKRNYIYASHEDLKEWVWAYNCPLPSKPVSDFFLPDTTVKDEGAEAKAKELIDKFQNELSGALYSPHNNVSAKQCALICVDEIINTYKNEAAGHLFWDEVRQAISNL